MITQNSLRIILYGVKVFLQGNKVLVTPIVIFFFSIVIRPSAIAQENQLCYSLFKSTIEPSSLLEYMFIYYDAEAILTAEEVINKTFVPLNEIDRKQGIWQDKGIYWVRICLINLHNDSTKFQPHSRVAFSDGFICVP